MKHYTISIGVPDDFDPEKFELDANYPDGDIVLEGEGFANLQEVADKVTIDVKDITKNSVAVFKFPQELAEKDPFSIQLLQQGLENQLGCTVIGICDSIDILVQNSSEAITMLKKMIDKINSKAIIKLV